MKKEGNAIILSPDDIIRLDIGKKIRVWKVTSVCLGSEREEDLIGIKTLDMRPGSNGAQVIKEMFVPRHIIEDVIKNNDITNKFE